VPFQKSERYARKSLILLVHSGNRAAGLLKSGGRGLGSQLPGKLDHSIIEALISERYRGELFCGPAHQVNS